MADTKKRNENEDFGGLPGGSAEQFKSIQEETRRRAVERVSERQEATGRAWSIDSGEASIGWTAQQGGTALAEAEDEQVAPAVRAGQTYTPDQLPDPDVAQAAGLAPQDLGGLTVVDGEEGHWDEEWKDDTQPKTLDSDEALQSRPWGFGDTPYNFKGNSADFNDPNVGWTAQLGPTDTRRDEIKDPLIDPQTKGLFPVTPVFTNAQLPDTTKYPAGWKQLPGYNTNDRSPKFLTTITDADATDHPRGPEPATVNARGTKREAVKDRLNTAGVWSEVNANAGADQTVAATGVTVTLSGSGTGPTGHTLTYKWSQFGSAPAGTTVTLNTPNAATTTFTAPAANVTLGFTLAVTDTTATPNRTYYDDVIVTVGTGGGTLATPIRTAPRGGAQQEDLNEKTVEELRDMASERDIEGRSSMNKDELVEALSSDQGGGEEQREQREPAEPNSQVGYGEPQKPEGVTDETEQIGLHPNDPRLEDND